MKLKHLVFIGFALIGIYVGVHFLFTHGGMAKVGGAVGLGGTNARFGAGIGR